LLRHLKRRVEVDQERMPKPNRLTDPRVDGSITTPGPSNTQQNVLIEGLPASLVGDLDSYNNLGAIISMSPGSILVNGIPLAIGLMDSAAPDVEGITPHPEGLPTPTGGSGTKTTAYGPNGTFGGGLGSFGLTGMPGIGEIMQIGSQIMGQVMRTASTGGQNGMMLMNNMNPANTAPTAGQTVTSANTGKTFTFSNYYSS
jgi:hypothetical protein